MKLIVGLGNPGSQYRKTRHNVGFMALDAVSKAQGSSFKKSIRFNAEIAECVCDAGKVLLVKPLTYMNNSGTSVAALMRWYRVEARDVLVVYDDLDLAVAQLRFRATGSSGGHRGLESIIQHMGTDAVQRIKIGIGRDQRMDAAQYVLEEFGGTDKDLIEMSITAVVTACQDWIEGKKIVFVPKFRDSLKED